MGTKIDAFSPAVWTDVGNLDKQLCSEYVLLILDEGTRRRGPLKPIRGPC